jgi:hypothetical protein
MPELERAAQGIYGKNIKRLPSPGPWLGVVTNHLDPTYMGGLEVSLIQATQGTLDFQNETFVVQYCSPFMGSTSVTFEGNNSADFNSVQKSYGFWGVPPDLGATVMCIFIDGNPNQGYWIGCVQDQFQNHMIPGIAASLNIEISPEDEQKYGTKFLPVAEFHKKSRKDSTETGSSINTPSSYNKPIFRPFADRLLAQGLLLDTVRGPTSSSARREVPSAVFGISTPGPIDPNTTQKASGLKYNDKDLSGIPVGRLGGSSFVMDDGDKDGKNELVRIRTRTGHQILLHNSQDLIYIANSKGSAWVELTSNGKIDIYANDSVSIHTENDFNFRADRDVNIEAGRDMNLSVRGSFQLDVVNDYTLIVEGNGQIAISGDVDHTTEGDFKNTITGDMHIGSGGSIFQTAISQTHIKSGTEMFYQSGASYNLAVGADYKLTATGSSNISSAHHIESAGTIDMNGPDAAKASPTDAAYSAMVPSGLPKFYVPGRNKDAGWENGQFYKAEDIETIMKRVPTHEPWDQHENLNSEEFSPSKTDIGAAAPTKRDKEKGTGTTGPGTTDNPPDNLNRKEMAADWVKDIAFIKKVQATAKVLKCSYTDLLACMAFETGRTFNPALRNSIGATGLIQFIRPTAIALGTTTDALAAMTRVEQMAYVETYFKKGPVAKVANPQLEDLYMQILWPAAVGKSLDYVLFKAPDKAYEQNKGLDREKKGYVTKSDAASKVRDQLSYIRTQLLKVPDEGGVVTDGSGNPIKDGSGNPVRYGPAPGG